MPKSTQRGIAFASAALLILMVIGAQSTPDAVRYGAEAAKSAAVAPDQMPANDAHKISPQLAAQLAAHPDQLRYMVVLREQATTSNQISPRYWNEKGNYVVDRLQETARRTQPAVTSVLDSFKAQGIVQGYKTFWIVNAIYVEGAASTVSWLAGLDAVASLDVVHSYREQGKNVDGHQAAPRLASRSANIPWNIEAVGAPTVWASGDYGQGITVGSIDSGAVYTHEAIYRQYRGYQSGSNNYNWFDPLYGTTSPSDYLDHGTHTIGTILGENPDKSEQIGVAPHANWISCRIFGAAGIAYDNDILSCGQFMLAPTDVYGNDAQPELRPQILSCSWGNDNSSDQTLRPMVQAWLNAGIFPSFAGGNNGGGASTIASPASFPESIASGAYDQSGSIAYFSAWGPSPIDGRIKPEVTAPGIGVLSSVGYDNGYAEMDGTSMAQPHVAGTAALLLAKNRTLSVAQLRQTITSTTYFSSYMGTRPNNIWGWGWVRADNATASVQAANGTLVGRVTDTGGQGIGSAIVSAAGDGSAAVLTDPSGYYTATLASGSYTATASLYSYQPSTGGPISVTVGLTATQNLTLTAATTYLITGNLIGPHAEALSGLLSISPTLLAPLVVTSSYNLSVPAGSYEAIFTPANNCLATTHIPFNVPLSSTVDIAASYKHDQFGYSCDDFNLPLNWITGTTEIYMTGDSDATVIIPPPPNFNFSYYGVPVTNTIGVSVDGFIEFGGRDEIPYGQGPNIPGPVPPFNVIYAMRDWLQVYGGGGHVFYAVTGIAPYRKLAIEWQGVSHNLGGGTSYGNYTFEIVLEETTNNIYLEYLAMNGPHSDGDDALIGMENATGSDGISYSYLRPGALHSGLAFEFHAPCAFYQCPGAPSPTPTPPPLPTSTPTPTACAGVPSAWRSEPPLPGAATFIAGAATGGKLYTFSSASEVFDPQTNNWSSRAAPPFPVSRTGAAAVGSNIYVPGGVGNNNYPEAAMQIYDTNANSWHQGARLPLARMDSAVAQAGGKVYIFGGETNTYPGTPQDVYAYDPATDSYSNKAPLPEWSVGGAAVQLNGLIYVLGGLDSYLHYVYNPQADSWAQIAPGLTASFDHPAAFTLNGEIWLVGGSDDSYNPWPGEEAVQIYNPQRDSWRFGPPLPVGQVYPVGGVLGTRGYLVGGTPNQAESVSYDVTPFTDIDGNLFAPAIEYLYCRGQVSGTDASHYSPAATATRGQFARVVVKGFGLPIITPTGGGQSFSDVPPTYFAYNYVETGYGAGILSGYDQATCLAVGVQYPCYLPNRAITRAELTRLVVKAAGYPRITPTTGPTFVDVPASYFAYTYIETAAAKGVVRGVDATHFAPGRNIRRDEMAQIVYKGVTTP